MSTNTESIKLQFKYKPSSQGFIAQGVELPSIIIESATEQQLVKDLDVATDCYFESFPEEKQKFILAESEQMARLEKFI